MWSILICFLWSIATPFVGGTKCPNTEFKLVAKYQHLFHLKCLHRESRKTKCRYWVAFGANGKWVVELVDVFDHIKHHQELKKGKEIDITPSFQTFTCSEDYWGFVTEIVADKSPPVCCVAAYQIDKLISESAAGEPPLIRSNPFAVLPHTYLDALEPQLSPRINTPDRTRDDSKFYWMSLLRGRHAHGGPTFWSWSRVKITNTVYNKRYGGLETGTPFRDILYDSGVEFITLPDFEHKADRCVSASHVCDTGITADLVAFHVECDKYSYIKFGFSANGMFEMSFFKCPGTKENHIGILYYPVPALFISDEQRPSYNSLGLGWKLGSFCASCPSTAIKMTITEKEAKMNKERLQHSLSFGAGATAIPAMLSVNAKYTLMWFKEAAETITSGRSTTISATCNGFYLWYWTVSIGTWGEGTAVIPTQLFYCTDRDTSPICRPKIAGMKDSDEFGKLCNGHDVEADFNADAVVDATQEWQSMHSGRPKPVRLQGQRGREAVFKVMDDRVSAFASRDRPRPPLERVKSAAVRSVRSYKPQVVPPPPEIKMRHRPIPRRKLVTDNKPQKGLLVGDVAYDEEAGDVAEEEYSVNSAANDKNAFFTINVVLVIIFSGYS